MRTLAAALCALATGAGADCLPPGKTPAKVTFADGAVIDGITRQGNTLRYQSHPQPDQTTEMQALWGIYPMQSSFNGNAVRYDWQGVLPDPASLTPGREVQLFAQQVTPATATAYAMTVRLLGTETMVVGDCHYPVLHLAVTMGTPTAVRAEGERWLDPEHLVIWATKTRILDKDGNLERELSSQAVAAE